MKFEFATATRILFGRQAADQAAEQIGKMGTRFFIVTGKSPERAQPLVSFLQATNGAVTEFATPGEPTVDLVQAATEKARSNRCDVVVGIGGGSAIDTGKAVAALLTNDGTVLDYLEVIGAGKPITHRPAPFAAIPTTSGTGAEVTKNAVIGSTEHQVKVSMRSPLMLPVLAVVDPELTRKMPKEVTASTGMDALTQLIEPYVSNSANPLTDSLCREGMMRGARSLLKAYKNGEDIDARQDMCLASLFGGMALANAKLGAVHGFAGPIGGMFDAPHGAVCATLLPNVIAANVGALKKRCPTSPALLKLDSVAKILTGSQAATAQEGVDFVRTLASSLNLPSLSSFGISESDLETIAEKSKNSSSMKGNPIALTDAELIEILHSSL